MNSFFNLNFFRSGIFWILFLAFITSILLYYVAPNYVKELEDFTFRLMLSSLVFFGPLVLVLLYIVFLQEKTKLALKNIKDEYAENKDKHKTLSNNIKDIKTKFNDAIKILSRSSLYKDTRRARYELPWYLLIGKSQEGKTSLLEGSGLDFPLNNNFDQQKIQEISSSDMFQWYFCENAVFVDMPGKYINPNEDDSIVWKKGFLNLFAKKRSKRPLNGMILNLSIDTLMQSDEIHLEQYAKDLRDRFDELSEGFTSSIPIYLVITKSDKIPGFNEYFSSISKSEKDEVFGITFDNPSDNIDSKLLNEKFTKLISRINSSVLDKLYTEMHDENKNNIYLFSNSITNLFEKMNIFTDICFAQTRYRKPLMLRGIYFTSIPEQVINNNEIIPLQMLDKTKVCL